MRAQYIESSIENLGEVDRVAVQAEASSIKRFSAHKIVYPGVVINALGQLYQEYNRAFGLLVEANREWPTDYQYCLGNDGQPINHFVQIDMVGLQSAILNTVTGKSVAEVREILRGMVFEIENSLAMYQILERTFACGDQPTAFSKYFRTSLNQLRATYHKPIALLAVTEQKYQEMAWGEFGVKEDEVSDALVQKLSGFDRFFGPSHFSRYLAENQGRCDYLLYVRASDPKEKLKKPDTLVEHPLLGDVRMRQIIKANTLTFNVDAPEMEYSRRINDTKRYMVPMKMGFEISAEADLLSDQLQKHVLKGRAFSEFEGPRLSLDFTAYLQNQGIDSKLVGSGEVWLRFKPLKGSYGCYGHRRGALTEKDLRGDMRRELRVRGSYIVQPEVYIPAILNTLDGCLYQYIDRNIFSFTAGRPQFLGGFRGLIPVDSHEAKEGRIHANEATIWAEIVGP